MRRLTRNVFRGRVATDQPAFVTTILSVSAGGNGAVGSRNNRCQQEKAGEQRGPHIASITAIYRDRHSHCDLRTRRRASHSWTSLAMTYPVSAITITNNDRRNR